MNLLGLPVRSLEQLVRDLGWPRYRVQQLARWMYQKRVHSIEEMTDLSKENRMQLGRIAHIRRFQDCQTIAAADETLKLLGRLEDGLRVETVYIPDGDRGTLCLSTQVGCTLDCTFCLTATMGLKRNLKGHEIVDQVLTAQDHLGPTKRLTNVVLMGMGEPLANSDAVAEATHWLTDSTYGLGISPRRITLSTAGWAPRLHEVSALGINLAVSLNATTNQIRDQLMPTINRLYPLEVLLTQCRKFPLSSRQRLTFEYVLLAGINDSMQDAQRLPKLLAGIRCKVNLIPFNEFPGSRYRRPTDSHVLAFQHILIRTGLRAFIRKSKGRDVLGACGQLGSRPVPHHSAPLIPAAAVC